MAIHPVLFGITTGSCCFADKFLDAPLDQGEQAVTAHDGPPSGYGWNAMTCSPRARLWPRHIGKVKNVAAPTLSLRTTSTTDSAVMPHNVPSLRSLGYSHRGVLTTGLPPQGGADMLSGTANIHRTSDKWWVRRSQRRTAGAVRRWQRSTFVVVGLLLQDSRIHRH